MLLQVAPFHVVIGGAQSFSCVVMKDFLTGLAHKLEQNTTAWDNYERMYLPVGEAPETPHGSPLRTKTLFKHVQVCGCSSSPTQLPQPGPDRSCPTAAWGYSTCVALLCRSRVWGVKAGVLPVNAACSGELPRAART